MSNSGINHGDAIFVGGRQKIEGNFNNYKGPVEMSNDKFYTNHFGTGDINTKCTVNNQIPNRTNQRKKENGSESEKGQTKEKTDNADFEPIPLIYEKPPEIDDPKVNALIMNIHRYDPPHPPHTRHGSEVDVANLLACFLIFGIGVYYPLTEGIRVTHKHIADWIQQFKSKFTQGSTSKATFVVLMGHGGPGVILDSDGEPSMIEQNIFAQFNNQNFRAMIEQPKIFIMNCCRGVTLTPAVSLDGTVDGPGERKIATTTDMKIFWSTTPDNTSNRNEAKGSVFIKHLCECLEFCEEQEIKKIIELVAHKTSTETAKNNPNTTQTPTSEDRDFGKFILKKNDFSYECYE